MRLRRGQGNQAVSMGRVGRLGFWHDLPGMLYVVGNSIDVEGNADIDPKGVCHSGDDGRARRE